ncbi:hypothetical protein [Zavarzinia compransoris]|uniref:Uncharacterized protein n=1 Tax=Zavarzinia compransoris TaxID=1264899 RepID=A0A317EC47_9PROT|nr:hypothetical protein [Zavarzinia compransoris]PWR23690.1 hypothetical protein DKG75_03740 [Zavarzinia compransoris]TDP47910.1 hypothetical protein DES42_102206 [Zavarzinia compransoris]
MIDQEHRPSQGEEGTFERVMAVLAWACRPALLLFPVLVIAEVAGLVPMEVTIPFAAMAAIHAAGRRYLPPARDGEGAPAADAPLLLRYPVAVTMARPNRRR